MSNIFDQRLALSGATLHHIGLLLEAEEAREARRPCAWCDHELGLPLPPVGASHTICARHLAAMKAELAEKQLAA